MESTNGDGKKMINWVNNNFAPQQQMQVSQQIPQPVRRIAGRWQEIGSYQEMQAIPLPFDGTPILFMLENEPMIYIAAMQSGQRCVSGFRLEPLTVDSGQTITTGQVSDETDTRLKQLENQMQKLMNVLEERVLKNEPNTTTVTPK